MYNWYKNIIFIFGIYITNVKKLSSGLVISKPYYKKKIKYNNLIRIKKLLKIFELSQFHE